MKLLTELNRLLKDEDGLTMVEYAVAGGLIAVGVAAAFITLSENIDKQIICIGQIILGAECAS
ncbi:hypothetical protein CBP31_14225 [Oceanisphaera profunda]|uniref:Flp family type IVb pilin n=1 Tax=Oceanisphaera profunda TaxID=1416627 RepID=A0A1Y0D8N9_9GAMM|nr:hypothetical protein [Oceanisphaera profunda]ART83644.1 hypothetical protein CBP31_14225 [Oceanisphaera profunda]